MESMALFSECPFTVLRDKLKISKFADARDGREGYAAFVTFVVRSA